MTKHKAHMGSRYIELFRCSQNETVRVLAYKPMPILQEHSIIIKMRGLPYSTTEQEVNEFFKSENGTIWFTQDIIGRPSGEAFVEFASEEAANEAFQKDKQNIGSRYIELFKSSPGELMANWSRRRAFGNGRGGFSRYGRGFGRNTN